MHGARGQHENALQPHGAGALLDAAQQLVTVALALDLGADRDRRHLPCLFFGIGIKRRTTENYAVVFDHGVKVRIALNFMPLPFDQRTVFFKRLNQLQDGANVLNGGLTQAFEFLVHHHGANAVVHVDFEQEGPIHCVRNDMATLHAISAGRDAMPQIKRQIGGFFGKWQLPQDALGVGQW